jgi:hypothetical protein
MEYSYTLHNHCRNELGDGGMTPWYLPSRRGRGNQRTCSSPKGKLLRCLAFLSRSHEGHHDYPVAYDATSAPIGMQRLLCPGPSQYSPGCSRKCTISLTLALLLFYRARPMDRLDWAGSREPVLFQYIEQLEGHCQGAPKG